MDGPDEVLYHHISGAPVMWDGEINTIKLGTNFKSKNDMKYAIQSWSINRGASYYVLESRPHTWCVECSKRRVARQNGQDDRAVCNWKIRASKQDETGKWQIVVWVDGHSCGGGSNPGREDRNCSQDHVAHLILEKIQNCPNYPLNLIQIDVLQRYGCQIGKKKAWDGRRVAQNMVFGDPVTNFLELPHYMQALMNSNVGTVVQWKFGNQNMVSKKFRYVFWAFGPSILTFQHCHPVVTIDATHLRGTYKGKAIVAMVKTANKRILPVAYAIIDEETEHSWSWFLKYLKRYVLRRTKTCIISDRHQGILAAVEKLDQKCPGWGVHRYCLQHIRANLLQRVPKIKGLKAATWAVGTELQQHKYVKAWDVIAEKSQRAYAYLQNIPLESWTLYDDGFYRWGIATSNDAESYNNVLRGDRFLPIRAFVQATHEKANRIFDEERDKIRRCNSPLAPTPMAIYESYRKRARLHKVSRYDRSQGIYSVRTPVTRPDTGGHTHIVRFQDRSCSCRKWETYRIPCSHAIAVCQKLRVDPFTYVHDCYTKEGWIRQFSGVFSPVSTEWPEMLWKLLPDETRMIHHSGPGRRRTARLRGGMDFANTRGRRPRTCSRCGATNHNIRRCPISHPPADRQPLNMLYNPYEIQQNQQSDDDM